MIHLYKIFGKIVDGQLQLAPDVVNNIHGFKYNESLCLESGYKEVKYITTDKETIFTDKGTHIQQEELL